MISRLTMLLLVIGFPEILSAQFPNVLISNTNDPEEVSICINPLNPLQVVAGANLNNVYYSTDGGLTWNANILTEPTYSVWGDPIITVDTNGHFYYSHLSNPPSGSWIDRIVFQKSTDGGASWSTGTFTGLNGTKDQDKEGVVVNPFNNEIYVTWTQFDDYNSSNTLDSSLILFSKSSDGGATWSTPLRISKYGGDCIDSDNTVEGAVPSVGPSGEIYVTWVGINGIVFNKSLDGGLTWLPAEELVTSVPGGWDYNIAGLQRCNGLPAQVCDLSGGVNHGTIYVNWTDQRNGTTDTDVWLIKSSDGGNTWSTPFRVNDDPVGKQQFLSWMTIDQATGYLYVIYYDRRNHPAGSELTDVYLAVSTDGGNSFTNYLVNSSSFDPSPSVFFGDYTGISAHNNMVRPIWMEYDSGTLSVWTAIVDATTLGFSERNNHPLFAEMRNDPNPFSSSTSIHFSLQNSDEIDLEVYNAAGQQVATLYRKEKFKKGEFDYVFNPSAFGLGSGLYYYRLKGKDFEITRKMVVY